MKHPPFTYHRPESLADALALLAEFGLDAGGIAESVAKEWFRGQFA